MHNHIAGTIKAMRAMNQDMFIGVIYSLYIHEMCDLLQKRKVKYITRAETEAMTRKVENYPPQKQKY